MSTSSPLTTGILLVLILGVVAQTAMLWDLQSQVDGLRVELASRRGPVRPAVAPGAIGSPPAVSGSFAAAPSSSGDLAPATSLPSSPGTQVGPLEVAPDAVRRAVEHALEDEKRARIDQWREGFARRKAEEVGERVDAAIADGLMTETERAHVEDLLAGHMTEAFELKAAVRLGDMNEADAWGEYDEIRADYVQALRDAVGEEATTALLSAGK